MATTTLEMFSSELADVVAAAAASVIQVAGGRRPGSGLVYADGVALTTVRALGREEGLHVRRPDGQALDAELAGWDPATNLAVLRVPGLDLPAVTLSNATPRPGHLAIGIARSWSNALTSSVGIVSVIGGPLPTGPRRAIDQVIRTTAPMHDGFSGGGLFDASGRLIGVATAARIRGLGVVIPAPIAWKTAASVIEHGKPRRGYIGIAAQGVVLPAEQRTGPGREAALLVVGVTAGSPAARAGVLVGDVMSEFDGHAVHSPDDLLDLLLGDRVGKTVPLRLLRGGQPTEVSVEVGERPGS